MHMITSVLSAVSSDEGDQKTWKKSPNFLKSSPNGLQTKKC